MSRRAWAADPVPAGYPCVEVFCAGAKHKGHRWVARLSLYGDFLRVDLAGMSKAASVAAGRFQRLEHLAREQPLAIRSTQVLTLPCPAPSCRRAAHRSRTDLKHIVEQLSAVSVSTIELGHLSDIVSR